MGRKPRSAHTPDPAIDFTGAAAAAAVVQQGLEDMRKVFAPAGRQAGKTNQGAEMANGNTGWTRKRIWGYEFRILDDDLLPFGLVSYDDPLLYVGKSTGRYMIDTVGEDLMRGTEMISSMIHLKAKQVSLVEDASWLRALLLRAADACTEQKEADLQPLLTILLIAKGKLHGLEDEVDRAIDTIRALQANHFDMVGRAK